MSKRRLQFGDIVTIQFPLQTPQGHEQMGYRPAIVVGIPTQVGVPRFPLIIVAPLTTHKNQSWALAAPELYPRLPANIAGLTSPSIVLLDQIRAVDAKRIINYRGSLTAEQYSPISAGIQQMLQP